MTGVKLILTAILFRVLFLRLPHHLYTLVIVPLCHNRRSIFTLGCHKRNDLEPVLDVIQYFPCKMDFLFCPAKGGWIYIHHAIGWAEGEGGYIPHSIGKADFLSGTFSFSDSGIEHLKQISDNKILRF